MTFLKGHTTKMMHACWLDYQHFTIIIRSLPMSSTIAGGSLLSYPDVKHRDSGHSGRGKYKPHLQYGK